MQVNVLKTLHSIVLVRSNFKGKRYPRKVYWIEKQSLILPGTPSREDRIEKQSLILPGTPSREDRIEK